MKLLPVIGAVGLATALAFPASVALTTIPATWSIVAGLVVYSLYKGLNS